MLSGRSRREFVRIASTAVSGLIAGCGARSGGDELVSVTPAPVPTTATETPEPTPKHLAELSDRFEFEVEVRSGFTPESPARLEITVWNRTDTQLTALAGSRFVLPFVDRDYAGIDQSGDPGLSLVPDETRLIVDRDDAEPARLTALLPEAPKDGCWRLPFEWAPAWMTRESSLKIATLVPGEWRSHRYGLYFIGDCGPGTFTFENRFDIAVGQAAGERELLVARLGFDVTVAENGEIRVNDQTAEITLPSGGIGRK
ncbi:MAG: hypothetical protein ABEH59_10390 [Halobacteriales archaeon]